MRYKYVNEHVEHGIVEIVFVKSAEGGSDSDILTKNLSEDQLKKDDRSEASMIFLNKKVKDLRKGVRDDVHYQIFSW